MYACPACHQHAVHPIHAFLPRIPGRYTACPNCHTHVRLERRPADVIVFLPGVATWFVARYMEVQPPEFVEFALWLSWVAGAALWTWTARFEAVLPADADLQ